MNNIVKVSGTVITAYKFNHAYMGERFYRFYISVSRDNRADVLPVIVSEKLINIDTNDTGKRVSIQGAFKSHNSAGHVLLYISPYIMTIGANKDYNDIFISGVICIAPTAHYGKASVDFTLAVNRGRKSDYIPCVAWGLNAFIIDSLEVGDNLRVAGRLQSRHYTKYNKILTAYEVAVNMVEVA